VKEKGSYRLFCRPLWSPPVWQRRIRLQMGVKLKNWGGERSELNECFDFDKGEHGRCETLRRIDREMEGWNTTLRPFHLFHPSISLSILRKSQRPCSPLSKSKNTRLIRLLSPPQFFSFTPICSLILLCHTGGDQKGRQKQAIRALLLHQIPPIFSTPYSVSYNITMVHISLPRSMRHKNKDQASSSSAPNGNGDGGRPSLKTWEQ